MSRKGCASWNKVLIIGYDKGLKSLYLFLKAKNRAFHLQEVMIQEHTNKISYSDTL